MINLSTATYTIASQVNFNNTSLPTSPVQIKVDVKASVTFGNVAWVMFSGGWGIQIPTALRATLGEYLNKLNNEITINYDTNYTATTITENAPLELNPIKDPLLMSDAGTTVNNANFYYHRIASPDIFQLKSDNAGAVSLTSTSNANIYTYLYTNGTGTQYQIRANSSLTIMALRYAMYVNDGSIFTIKSTLASGTIHNVTSVTRNGGAPQFNTSNASTNSASAISFANYVRPGIAHRIVCNTPLANIDDNLTTGSLAFSWQNSNSFSFSSNYINYTQVRKCLKEGKNAILEITPISSTEVSVAIIYEGDTNAAELPLIWNSNTMKGFKWLDGSRVESNIVKMYWNDKVIYDATGTTTPPDEPGDAISINDNYVSNTNTNLRLSVNRPTETTFNIKADKDLSPEITGSYPSFSFADGTFYAYNLTAGTQFRNAVNTNSGKIFEFTVNANGEYLSVVEKT